MRRAAIVLVSASFAACASANSATSSDNLSLRAAPARSVLTAAEIVASRVSDAYQAVSQLRPDFLRRRYATVMLSLRNSGVLVYLDEMPFGEAESLRHIPLERVRTIRYLSAFDADLRWGGSHPAGAILVTTMKR